MLPRLRWVLLIVALLSTLPVQAQDPRPLSDEALQEEFTAFVQSMMAHYQVPGAAVALVQRGNVVYAEGFGTRSPNSDEPITPDTLFQIGTLTNPLTTMMVAAMVEEGLITWDTPLEELDPEFADTAYGKIPLRFLLSMSAGLPANDLIFTQADLTFEDMATSLSTREAEPDETPGEAYDGSQFGFDLAAYASTFADDGDYEDRFAAYRDLMQRYVLDAMFMESATFSNQAVLDSANYALPVDRLPGGEALIAPYLTWPDRIPSHNLSANLLDMARLVVTQLKEGIASPMGDRALSAQLVRETRRLEVNLSEETGYQALLPSSVYFGNSMGWRIGAIDNRDVYFYSGYAPGYTGLVIFMPDLEMGMVVLSNLNDNDAFTYTLFNGLYMFMTFSQPNAIDRVMEYHNSLLAQQTAMNFSQAFSAETVRDYLGSYEGGWRLELRDAEGQSNPVPESGSLWLLRGERAWQLLNAEEQIGYTVGLGTLAGSNVELLTEENNENKLFRIITPAGDEGEFIFVE